jgi:uncharacterized protein YkwD
MIAPSPVSTTHPAPRFRVAAPGRLASIVLAAFALTSVGLLAAPRTTLAWDVNSYSSASESKLVSLTNQARAAAGLRALKVDAKLASIARWRSKDMIQRNYFSHTILGTSYNVFHVLDQKGYCYRVAGENIGWNNYPDDVATTTIQRQFMESPDHRANILGRSWDVIGIGAYKGPTGKKMWTVLFADRCGSTTTSPKPTPKPTAKPIVTSPKPKPAATPRPAATPAPTPPPTPQPAPTETPGLAEDAGLGLGPGGQGIGNGKGDENGDGGSSGGGPPPGQVRDADPARGEGGLRVTDPASPPSLFESVVGGIAGFFLGL